MTVSVCIPTYKRHDLLCHCLQSIFPSTVRPLEIVVSDDAAEPELARRLDKLPRPEGVVLRYVENELTRGEAGNVRNALEHASHEVVVLMHDDDFFLPGGIDALWQAWQAVEGGVDAIFGRQRVVDAEGRFLPRRTTQWNAAHHRLVPRPVRSQLWSALVKQFPMNGMMLRRSIALTAPMPAEHEVGGNTDLHFGIGYAGAASRPFLLIDAEVSAYRLSQNSKQRPRSELRLDGHLNYAALQRVEPQTALERRAQQQALAAAGPPAVLGLLAQRDHHQALKVFLRHPRSTARRPGRALKLATLLVGALLGVRWSEATLRRRRLGLTPLSDLKIAPTAPRRPSPRPHGPGS